MGPMIARASKGTVIPTPTPMPMPVQSLFASEWAAVGVVESAVADVDVLVVGVSLLLSVVVTTEPPLVITDTSVEVELVGDELEDEDDEVEVVDWVDDDVVDVDEVEVIDGEDGDEDVDEDEEVVEELVEDVAADDARDPELKSHLSATNSSL
jgi:hypothetical protein